MPRNTPHSPNSCTGKLQGPAWGGPRHAGTAHEAAEPVLWGPGSKSTRRPDRALAGHCPPGRDQTDDEPCFAGPTHTVGPAGPPRPVANMGHRHLPSASDSLPSTRHAGPNLSVLKRRMGLPGQHHLSDPPRVRRWCQRMEPGKENYPCCHSGSTFQF